MKKFILIIILAAALLGLTFIVKPRQAVAPEDQKTAPVTDQRAVIGQDRVQYYGITGKNALELLQTTTAVEFKQYDFGVFVESINGIKPDDKHFWKLYVNGQESQVGADQLQTKNGDVIEWKLEEIKN